MCHGVIEVLTGRNNILFKSNYYLLPAPKHARTIKEIVSHYCLHYEFPYKSLFRLFAVNSIVSAFFLQSFKHFCAGVDLLKIPTLLIV